jgi:hypothetical protein
LIIILEKCRGEAGTFPKMADFGILFTFRFKKRALPLDFVLMSFTGHHVSLILKDDSVPDIYSVSKSDTCKTVKGF